MEQKKVRWLNIITSGCMILMLITAFFVSLEKYKKIDFSFAYNEVRAKLNHIRDEIEAGNEPKCEHPYMVLDLDGTVRYADKAWERKIGDHVVIEEMIQQDKYFKKKKPGFGKYSLVLKDDQGKCDGFVVFLLPDSMLQGDIYTKDMAGCFLPIGIGCILCCILIVLRAIYENKRILLPLQRITSSAQAIISGDYDVEVQRVYEENLKANEIGELTYSFEMMRDELKAKQLSEQALRKAQQELISCISHDLRTPISTIKAYGEGLRDGVIMEGMNQADYLTIILEKTNLLEKMIADLLEYSNTQLNKMDIVRKEVYFREYMMEISRELRIFVTQHGLNYASEIVDEDMIVNMDTRRITEVLYNLVENSLKYTPKENGEITLKADIVHGIATIHVIDNGVGLSAEDIPYVFDKFYRAEKSRSSDIPGSGLGLSICKYIINQHGGEIYCRSRKSQGSEFWFTLDDHQ